MPEFTKSPGWDWSITYQVGDEPVETMSVFGVMTIEEAVLEARRSFILPEDQAELVILKAERDG